LEDSSFLIALQPEDPTTDIPLNFRDGLVADHSAAAFGSCFGVNTNMRSAGLCKQNRSEVEGAGMGTAGDPAALLASAVRKIFLLATLLCFFAGCSKEPTLVVVVGGLGLSQLSDLRKSLEQQCPQATVVSAGDWDGYKADLKAIAASKPFPHVVFIGHSFGCQAIARAAGQLSKVDLAVFIDPAWDDVHLSKTIEHYLWFQRSGIGIEREAQIVGADRPKIIKGDHNSIPHSPELIAEVVDAVNGI
jgi:pimeloyl-ACP methyl ester carboxylesterase